MTMNAPRCTPAAQRHRLIAFLDDELVRHAAAAVAGELGDGAGQRYVSERESRSGLALRAAQRMAHQYGAAEASAWLMAARVTF